MRFSLQPFSILESNRRLGQALLSVSGGCLDALAAPRTFSSPLLFPLVDRGGAERLIGGRQEGISEIIKNFVPQGKSFKKEENFRFLKCSRGINLSRIAIPLRSRSHYYQIATATLLSRSLQRPPSEIRLVGDCSVKFSGSSEIVN